MRFFVKGLAIAAIRSINAWTGALIGSAALVAYLLAGEATALAIVDRANPTQLAGTLFCVLPYVSGISAFVGAGIGWVVDQIVHRTSLAGPTNGYIVTIGVLLVIVLGVISGVTVVQINKGL